MFKKKGLKRGGMGILLVVAILFSLMIAAASVSAASPPSTTMEVYVNFGSPATSILVHTYTEAELSALPQTTEYFKWWKSGGNIMFSKGSGVTLSNLISDLQTRNPDFDYGAYTSIKVTDVDGGNYNKTFTAASFADRYYYPNLNWDGSNPTLDLTGAVAVDAIFALVMASDSSIPCISQAALDGMTMDGSTKYRLMRGQTSAEANNNLLPTSGQSVSSIDRIDFYIPTPTYTTSQTWFLDNLSTGPVMEKIAGIQTGSVPVTDVTWLSDQKAGSAVTFETGFWTVNLNTTDLVGTYTVQIGESDGSNFNALSTKTTGTATGIPITLTFYITGATVPESHYLALQVTNTGTGSVITDGSSYLASPASTPNYPVPELATVVLLALGLAGLTGFAVIQKRKSLKNKTVTG
jgi:hypothetical protein